MRRTSSSAATAAARHSAIHSGGFPRNSSINAKVAAEVPDAARCAANTRSCSVTSAQRAAISSADITISPATMSTISVPAPLEATLTMRHPRHPIREPPRPATHSQCRRNGTNDPSVAPATLCAGRRFPARWFPDRRVRSGARRRDPGSLAERCGVGSRAPWSRCPSFLVRAVGRSLASLAWSKSGSAACEAERHAHCGQLEGRLARRRGSSPRARVARVVTGTVQLCVPIPPARQSSVQSLGARCPLWTYLLLRRSSL